MDIKYSCVENSAYKKCEDIRQKYSVIWLHGLGADGNDFVPMAKELDNYLSMPIRFIFPHADSRPVTLNNGYVMPAWYDITGLDIESREDRNGLDDTNTKIIQLIQHEIQSGILSEHIYLGGFSQGGAQAIYSGLRFDKTLAGMIVFSGYLPFYKSLSQEIQLSFPNYQAPIFWAQGLEDTIVPPLFGNASVAALKNLGCYVDFNSYPMAHQVCEKEIKDLAEWIMHRKK